MNISDLMATFRRVRLEAQNYNAQGDAEEIAMKAVIMAIQEDVSRYSPAAAVLLRQSLLEGRQL